MKKSILILLSLAVAYFSGSAQSVSPPSWAEQVINHQITFPTPDEFLSAKDSAIGILYPNDSTEGGPRAKFEQFRKFWSTRLPSDMTKTDVQKEYAKALSRSYGKDPLAPALTPCGDPESYRGDWTNLGPANRNDYQNQGMVKDIWFDPNDPTHIMVGTEMGGIFETTDDGANWTNITDNAIGIGTLGISSFDVNPWDHDEIWLSTRIPVWNTQWRYAVGVYHTTNGGGNWTMETTYPLTAVSPGLSADLVYAEKIKYIPYKVGGDAAVVMTIDDHVLFKKGTGAWTDLTPAGLTTWTIPWTRVRNLSDIEFPDEAAFKGTIVLSSMYDDFVSTPVVTGVWRVNFDPATGAVAAPWTILYNHINNGFTHNGNAVTLPTRILCHNIEYMGNGNFYMLSDINGNAEMSEFNLANVDAFGQINARNVLMTNINMPAFFINRFEVHRDNDNVAYVGSNFGPPTSRILYKVGTTWNIKHLGDQGSPPGRFHCDIRCIKIVETDTDSTTATSQPGMNDIVLWGQDGGLTRTSLHDITTSGSGAGRTAENLNGVGLYIADLVDIDHAPGHAITAAGWHNGWYNLDKNTGNWTGQVVGDGVNAKVDKRFTTVDDYRMIYQAPGRSYFTVDNPNVSNALNFIPNPEGGLWRPSPMQYMNDQLHMSVRRAWQSQPNGYGTPWINMHGIVPPLSAYGIELGDFDKFSPSLERSEADQNIAYHMISGRLSNWMLARGVWGGTWAWSDITQNLVNGSGPPGQKFIYTDMVLDPTDRNELYVSMGEIPWSLLDEKRVFRSTDGGATFTDISQGLPPVPVNCMAYQKGTDDVVYAGTDAGVYRWDKALNCWIKMDHKMPNCMVMELSINYCEGKLIAGTHGRGVWETDLHGKLAQPHVPVTIIPANSTVNWTESRYLEGDVLIESGATLNITGTLVGNDYTTIINMAKLSSIHIEPKGKLIIDGAHLMNSCGKTWNGIHAMGVVTASQVYNTPNDYYEDHGLVRVLSGRIQDAESALNNFEYRVPAFQTGGGVLQITDCEFINNRRAAQFVPYLNHNPAVTYPYVLLDESFFHNCSFTYDDATRQNTNESQITMWGIAGVQIRGCTFEQQMVNVPGGKYAIGSVDASYYLGSLDSQPSLVKGFSKGVVSDGFYKGNPYAIPIFIEDTEFDANTEGLNIQNTDWSFIRNNEFKVGSMPVNSVVNGGATTMYPGHGTSLSHTTRLKFCGNDFEKTYSSPFAAQNLFEYTWGSLFRSAECYPVLLNEYKSLHRGTQISGVGLTQNGGGLYFACNQNTENVDYDYLSYANMPTQSLGGNTFSVPGTTKHWYQITGPNIPLRVYGNTGVGTLPDINRTFNVRPVVRTPALCSAPNYDCDDGAIIRVLYDVNTSSNASARMSTLKSNYTSARLNEATLVSMLNLLIDDGDTDGTVDDIENSTSADQMAIRAEMLANSPYVSQEVLMELAQENILSHAILLEIILANPVASMSEGFIEFLQYEIPNPITSYMANLIRISWETPTNRQSLELQLEDIRREIYQTHTEILRIYKADLLPNSKDSFDVWVSKIPTLNSQYDKIEELLVTDQIAAAEVLLNSLTTTFEMDDEQTINHLDYVNLFAVKKEILQSGNKLNALSETQITNLTQIADGNHATFARDMARGVLCFFYNNCYPTGGEITQESSNKTIPVVKKAEDSDNNSFRVYPNPAKDHVTFQIMNPDKSCKDCKIIITDLHGRTVYEAELNELSGMHIWDTRKVATGAYIYQVKTNLSVESGKVVITK